MKTWPKRRFVASSTQDPSHPPHLVQLFRWQTLGIFGNIYQQYQHMTGASTLSIQELHYVPYYNKDLLPTSLKFLCCGESLFYLFDSKHENVVINYHYNCSSWNEKWWFVFHFSANVFSPEVKLDKYLFRAHVYWNKAGSAHYQVNIYHGNF